MVRKNKPKNKNTTVVIKRTTRNRLNGLKKDKEDFLDLIINRLIDIYNDREVTVKTPI
ncbi:hypothetical protein LCGC14_1188820 [marine sediment metagenome]|uniref:Uncharacterized protein n=1 Tax=marine sediment metagenome TaxID=412755 RepID=A0A0F9LPX6_9ZZZZ